MQIQIVQNKPYVLTAGTVWESRKGELQLPKRNFDLLVFSGDASWRFWDGFGEGFRGVSEEIVGACLGGFRGSFQKLLLENAFRRLLVLKDIQILNKKHETSKRSSRWGRVVMLIVFDIFIC